MNKNALLIFVKAPLPGKVKTRFLPDLTREQALKLYRAFVEDLISRLKSSTLFDMHIFFYPEKAFSIIENWLGHELYFHPQKGNNLGERISNALEWSIKQGYQKSILIGSDIPVLNEYKIENAFQKLNQSDVVIGPAMDGGYYLIGMKKYFPELFCNIKWSTDTVLNDTLKLIEFNKLSYFQQPTENDIDTFSDVLQLWEVFRQNVTFHETNTYMILKEIFSNREEITHD